MDPQQVFCHNWDCPARGQIGQGNITIHSRAQKRYRCQVCGQTFVAHKGTPFYRLHHTVEVVTMVITLLAYGCPLQAIVVAFGLDERTVAAWQGRAGEQCQKVQQHLVQQPRDLGQVQADEVRVKLQGGIVWMALALQVSTRLWLGGVVAPSRDGTLLQHLWQQVRACALCRPVLLQVDGFRAYLGAIRRTFRTPLPTGQRGRPVWYPWPGVCIGQVVKQYERGRVVGVVTRLVQGTAQQAQALLRQTQGSGQINTAYIERLNATCRAHLSGLVRRGRTLARQILTLQHGMYLVGTVYNFCTPHHSLRLAGIYGGHKWLPRTPAMAAGMVDHCWSVQELLSFQVPLPLWSPPQRRGRRSDAMKLLMARWCS